jgi:hypothetical protein
MCVSMSESGHLSRAERLDATAVDPSAPAGQFRNRSSCGRTGWSNRSPHVGSWHFATDANALNCVRFRTPFRPGDHPSEPQPGHDHDLKAVIARLRCGLPIGDGPKGHGSPFLNWPGHDRTPRSHHCEIMNLVICLYLVIFLLRADDATILAPYGDRR